MATTQKEPDTHHIIKSHVDLLEYLNFFLAHRSANLNESTDNVINDTIIQNGVVSVFPVQASVPWPESVVLFSGPFNDKSADAFIVHFDAAVNRQSDVRNELGRANDGPIQIIVVIDSYGGEVYTPLSLLVLPREIRCVPTD